MILQNVSNISYSKEWYLEFFILNKKRWKKMSTKILIYTCVRIVHVYMWKNDRFFAFRRDGRRYFNASHVLPPLFKHWCKLYTRLLRLMWLNFRYHFFPNNVSRFSSNSTTQRDTRTFRREFFPSVYTTIWVFWYMRIIITRPPSVPCLTSRYEKSCRRNVTQIRT